MIRKHRILSAIPIDEGSPAAYFAQLPSVDLERSVFFIEKAQPTPDSDKEGEDPELDAILQNQHNTNFKSEYGTLPFWRLLILTKAGVENEFTASFIFHHAIGDGAAGIIFHTAFREALEAAASSPSNDTPETQISISRDTSLLPSLEELHPLPIPESPPAPSATQLKEWTGGAIHAPCKSRYKSLYISPTSSKKFVQECKKKDVSVTAALTSLVGAVLFSILPSTTEALTGIIPVNLRPWLKLPPNTADSAIGTFIDAFKVQLRRPSSDSGDSSSTLNDIWPGAQVASKGIKDYLTVNISPSGEPYTAVAVFKTIPDVALVLNSLLGNNRDSAFEVSNLGVFPSHTKSEASPVWRVGKVTFSRSSVVSGAAVTLSVVSGGDGGLTIGFSWQEGVVEDAVVDKLISGVRKHFASHQGASKPSDGAVNETVNGATNEVSAPSYDSKNNMSNPIPYSQAAKLDPRIKIPRPIIDPALVPIIDSFPVPEELDIDFLRGVAAGNEVEEAFICNADTIIKSHPRVQHTEYSITGPDSNTIILSVFGPKQPTSAALPALYHIHGGGMVSGDRFGGVSELLGLVSGIESVVVSVEYRLAPETRAPGPAEDCYAGLAWISDNATKLGINPAKIVVWGVSGGAPLAAVTCLMARDRKIPQTPIKAQMLLSPMLDDRCEAVSDQQFEYGSPWCGVTNRKAWDLALGDDLRGTDKVTPYQAPARATDLSNLPQAYIDAAECEVFRDQAVAYATTLWRRGSTCELHVWPGAFHLFDGMDNPDVPIIRAAVEAKRNWLRRIMGPVKGSG